VVKQEEAAIIEREARLLKETIGKPENDVRLNTAPQSMPHPHALLLQKKMREMLVRALYCEMLGYSVPFAYIHALNMTQKPKLIDKRVGPFPQHSKEPNLTLYFQDIYLLHYAFTKVMS